MEEAWRSDNGTTCQLPLQFAYPVEDDTTVVPVVEKHGLPNLSVGSEIRPEYSGLPPVAHENQNLNSCSELRSTNVSDKSMSFVSYSSSCRYSSEDNCDVLVLFPASFPCLLMWPSFWSSTRKKAATPNHDAHKPRQDSRVL